MGITIQTPPLPLPLREGMTMRLTWRQQLPSLPLGPLGTLATEGTQEGEGQGVGSVIIKNLQTKDSAFRMD